MNSTNKKSSLAKRIVKVSGLTVTSFLMFTSANFYKPAQAVDGQYVVTVQTGCLSDAGTDASVFINIIGSKGSSGWKQLDTRKENDFEQCNIKDYSVAVGMDLGEINCIELTHDNKGNKPGWFVEFVTINGKTFSLKSWLVKPNLYIKQCII